MVHKKMLALVNSRKSSLRSVLLFCALLVAAGPLSSAQSRNATPVPQSDLAQENMAMVAASPGQIVTILRKDPGLLVELKRWMAKDATDHGQVISESDLTEEAILDRLENDIAFRSVATRLVQKYGYLQPTVNPESPLAREQELLMRERVRMVAQDEEQQRLYARKQGQSETQQTSLCNQGEMSGDSNCARSNVNPSNQGIPLQGLPSNQLPSGQVPYSNPGTTPPPAPQAPGNDEPGLVMTSQEDSGLGGSSALSPSLGDSSLYGQGSDSGQSADMLAGIYPDPLQDQMTGKQGGGSEASPIDLSMDSDFGDDSTNSYSTALNSPPSGSSSPAPSAGNPSMNSSLRDATLASDRRQREAISASQRMVRQPDPYREIPSLYDMYLQAAPRPPSVQRFGMQVFENGTRDLQSIPMDLPVGPDYVLGPGDALSLDLWGGVSRRFFTVVDREGRISLPEVGPVLVAGKSLAEVQEAVQKTLRTQFRDLSADVSLSRLRTIRVYVVGDVLHPGAYDISSLSTPLNALFAAGGPTGQGSLRIVKHYRGNQLVQDVDVYDLLLHGIKGSLERLENGDTVLIPPLGPEITIEGMVRRPAIYEEKNEKSLADVVALAGGLLPSAMLQHIEVQRTVAHEKRTMLSLDIPLDDPAQTVSKQIENFQVQEGDKIRIFPIAPYTLDAVYLEGHVIRPGKYSFQQGMRVTDLIGSYRDLLPEPALQYGEIIRLSEPDYRPVVQSFSLSAALADPKNAPELHPLDTVQIFGRYDFENPPAVSVWGDVRQPGTYRTSGDIHLSDAVHLAGGLGPDAATADAQVFRYLPDSRLKIINVKLSEALRGDPGDNILLNPRDRILIHRNAAALEPATVSVKGEVARPGRYPLTADMRISDLIRAAGGLKRSADTDAADLTHYYWNDDTQVRAQQSKIILADALVGKPDDNPVLNNGDVLTIRQVPGWQDLEASITIRGEVVHPGTYGIVPGERLSSVLRRAGGFAPGAYAYGTILMRSEVQKMEQRSYSELVQRVREQQASLKLTAASSGDPDQKLSAEAAFVQWQTTLNDLVASPPDGRVTVQISSNFKNWANTSRDIAVRSGDVLVVPKRPSYVLVQGQVYGPTAVAFRPGKSARWYLMQAGGPTNMANKRAIFVVRANGTVIGTHSSFWDAGSALNATLEPGDMVVAPERALGGPPIWKTLFQNAQVLSSIATSVVLASAY